MTYGYFCGLCAGYVSFETWPALKAHVTEQHQEQSRCDYCLHEGLVNVSGLQGEPTSRWCPDEQACDERMAAQSGAPLVYAIIPDYLEV